MSLAHHSFSKSQIAALGATVIDFSLLSGLVEIVLLPYEFATAIGALGGAIFNFWINRIWSFDATDMRWGPQMMRYFFVSLGSLGLNTGGVVFFTELLSFHYLLSKVVTALLVGVFYNYPLHRFFVYRKGSI